LTVGAGNPNQIDGLLNIIAVSNPETDPTGTREDVMRTGAAITNQFIPIWPAHETIEQTIAVNVAGLFPVKKETDAAKAVNAQGYSRKPSRIIFDGTDRAQTGWTQQRC
jgi:hypothetical protein